jgi:hypothetical protein
MIFTEPLAIAILRGEKTQTSRVLSDNPRSPWYRNRAAGERYPVGKVFTVNPGRGVPRVAECEVTARYRATISAVFTHDYKAEGFASRLALQDAWARLHPGFDPREVVDVVGFKLVGPDCMGCDGCGWCEGSPAWKCTDCFGTGIEVSVAAKALLGAVGRDT